jgi:DNA-binding LacI/PurR family transcriptional regulator
MAKVTLQTIADALGVSRSTVSNAYSRPDQLTADLRKKIMETAATLGYSGPDAAARQLRRGQANTVGVLFTAKLSYAFADPYSVGFLGGLAEVAEQYGTSLLLLPLREDDEAAAVQSVRDAVVDGFCVYCVPEWHPAIEALHARGLRVVGADHTLPAESGGYVSIDDEGAGFEVGDLVARFGHRDVAIVGDWDWIGTVGEISIGGAGEITCRGCRARVTGFSTALAKVGVRWEDLTLVHAGQNTRAAGAHAGGLALDRADRPTAILCTSDVLALGVLDALDQRGLRAGRDISVTGFDDIPEAARVGLTTINQPMTEKGRIAGRLLLDPPADPADRRVVLPTHLIPRATTGPAPHS